LINKLKLNNFKAFSSIQEMKFSPITLIYGPNSSGKSSIIQSLMLLKQTMLEKDANSKLITSGNAISLGGFESLISNHDKTLPMEFGIEYTSNFSAQNFINKYSYKQLFGNEDVRSVKFQYFGDAKGGQLEKFSFSCKDKTSLKVEFKIKKHSIPSADIHYGFESSENLRKVISRKKGLDAKKDGDSWNYLDQTLELPIQTSININIPATIYPDARDYVNPYLYQVTNDTSIIFKSLKYLGPLRSSPKRFYSAELNGYQRGQGKNNLGMDLYMQRDEVIPRINKCLNDFEIPYTLDVKNIGDEKSGNIISIQLTDLRNKAVVTPADVGFGIGQVLPIIMDALTCQDNTICVEQPEIHLHPRLQAHLADLFIESVSVDGGKNQWIIETHSEALILRLQKRIREGKIQRKWCRYYM